MSSPCATQLLGRTGKPLVVRWRRDPNGRVRAHDPARASAGRAKSRFVGRRVAALDHFADVKQALNKWLAEHDPKFRAGTF